MSYTVESFYQHIQDSWNNNESMGDMYHLILEWLQKYRPQDKYPFLETLVNKWLQDATDNVSTNDLVEDFLYSDTYKLIRETFRENS